MSHTIIQQGTRVYIDDVTCKRDTLKAILVDIDGEDHWIPVSQLDDETQVSAAGDCGLLVISTWIAKQRGLID